MTSQPLPEGISRRLQIWSFPLENASERRRDDASSCHSSYACGICSVGNLRAVLLTVASSCEEDFMAVRALSLREFATFNAARVRVARHTDKAVEWFADETGTILGAIAYHHLALDWSLVVLKQNGDGTFRAVERAAGLRVLDDARRLLIDKMTTARKTDDRIASSAAA